MPRRMRRGRCTEPPCGGIEIRQHGTTLYNSVYRGDDIMIVNAHRYGINAYAAHGQGPAGQRRDLAAVRSRRVDHGVNPVELLVSGYDGGDASPGRHDVTGGSSEQGARAAPQRAADERRRQRAAAYPALAEVDRHRRVAGGKADSRLEEPLHSLGLPQGHVVPP